MSGFFLESFHLSEALSDCIQCLPLGSRGRTDSDDDDDENDEGSTYSGSNPSVVSRRKTSRTSNALRSRAADVAKRRSGDYLDSCARRISETMLASMSDRPTALTVDALLDMTPIVNGQDVIQMAARHLLLCHVKSQENVRHVFFAGHQTNAEYERKIDRNSFDFGQLACLYVCQAICEVKDEYELYTMLDEVKIKEQLSSLYSSPLWKKLGFSLYTMLFEELVKDERSKIPFSSYLDNDRHFWARELSDRVRQKQWIYSNLINPVVQGRCTKEEYNRDLNILFIKLHLLNPASVMSTYDYLTKALPALNLELVTTNYLGGPLDCSLIKRDVERAIQKATYPNKRGQLTLANVEVFYGVEVMEFITNEAKSRDLWTGKHPDNRRISDVSERCRVM